LCVASTPQPKGLRSLKLETTIFLQGQFLTVSCDLTDDQIQSRLRSLWYDHVQKELNNCKRQLPSREVAQEFVNEVLSNFSFNNIVDERRDEIEEEALSLAEDAIRRQLAEQHLPAPKSIRDHAKVLISRDQSFMTRARQRMIARAEVVSETLDPILEGDL
jgi:hypothetical protein